MPIYEYECRGCGRVADALLGIGDPDPALECCGGQMRRIMPTSTYVKIDHPAGSAAERMADKNKAFLNSPEGKKHIEQKESEGYVLTKNKYAD